MHPASMVYHMWCIKMACLTCLAPSSLQASVERKAGAASVAVGPDCPVAKERGLQYAWSDATNRTPQCGMQNFLYHNAAPPLTVYAHQQVLECITTKGLLGESCGVRGTLRSADGELKRCQG